MDEQVTEEKCPCSSCLVSTTCTIIEDCEKWFSFFVQITDKLPEEISGNESQLEGVNTNNMKTLRDLIDKMLSVESTLVDLENSFGDLDSKVTQVERDSLQSESVHDMLKEVVEEHFADKLEDFENKVEDLEQAVDELKHLEEKVTDLEEQISDSDLEKIDDINNRLNDVECKYDDLENDVSDLKRNEDDTEDLRERVEREIVKDIVALKQAQLSVPEINGQFLDLNTRIEDLTHLINSNLPQGQQK